MYDDGSGVKIAALVVVGLVLIALVFGSCTAFQTTQRANVMLACLEKVEHVTECAIYGDPWNGDIRR